MNETPDTQRLSALVDEGDWRGVVQAVRETPALASARLGWAERTALHEAVIAGQRDTAAALLDLGADVMVRDGGDNATPLHWAADAGHLEIGRLLLERGADVNAVDDAHAWGPLGWAMLGEVPRPDMAAWLIESGARPTLFPLIALDDAEGIRALLAERPSATDERMSLWEHYELPLHLAISHGADRAARALLDAGADPDGCNWAGLSALAVAHLHGRASLAAELERRGARPDFSAAIVSGDHDLDDASPGSDVGVLGDGGRYGRLLHYLAQVGHASGIERLLDRGADPDLVLDWWDNRVAPLHPAASYGSVEAVRVLIEHGADPSCRDAQFDGTPLEWARHFDRSEVVDYLERIAR